jgi:hypothetical protein
VTQVTVLDDNLSAKTVTCAKGYQGQTVSAAYSGHISKHQIAVMGMGHVGHGDRFIVPNNLSTTLYGISIVPRQGQLTCPQGCQGDGVVTDLV